MSGRRGSLVAETVGVCLVGFWGVVVVACGMCHTKRKDNNCLISRPSRHSLPPTPSFLSPPTIRPTPHQNNHALTTTTTNNNNTPPNVKTTGGVAVPAAAAVADGGGGQDRRTIRTLPQAQHGIDSLSLCVYYGGGTVGLSLCLCCVYNVRGMRGGDEKGGI